MVEFCISIIISYFLGSGPDRGPSPVEWGEIPYESTYIRMCIHAYIRTYVLTYVCMYVHTSLPPQAPLKSPKAPLAGLSGWPSGLKGSDPSDRHSSPSGRPSDPSDGPSGPQASRTGSQTPLAGPQNPLADPLHGRRIDGQIYGWTNGISHHSKGLCPLSRPLPGYPRRVHYIKEAGQGNRRPHDAFWRLVTYMKNVRQPFSFWAAAPTGDKVL